MNVMLLLWIYVVWLKQILPAAFENLYTTLSITKSITISLVAVVVLSKTVDRILSSVYIILNELCDGRSLISNSNEHVSILLLK